MMSMLSFNQSFLPPLLAFGFLFCLLLLVLLKFLAHRYGWLDHPEDRKKHDLAVPHVGGLAMVGAIEFSSLLFPSVFSAPALVGSVLIASLGFVDDRVGLGSWLRLSLTAIILFVSFHYAGLKVTGLGDLIGAGPIALGFWVWPFTLLAATGSVNAMNLIDGVDGLAGGVVFGVLVSLALAYYLRLGFAPPEIGLFISVVLAFLVMNARYPGHPVATVFMGDSGSYLLGYLSIYLVLASCYQDPIVLRPISAAWILAYPVVHTLQVMYQRFIKAQGIHTAGRDHIHYLLIDRRGWSSARTSFVLTFLSAVLGLIGVLSDFYGVPERYLFVGLLLLLPLKILLSRWASTRPMDSGRAPAAF